MVASDAQLISAFKQAHPKAKSISVDRKTIWQANKMGMEELPVEVWIAFPNGETTIERGGVSELLAKAAIQFGRNKEL